MENSVSEVWPETIRRYGGCGLPRHCRRPIQMTFLPRPETASYVGFQQRIPAVRAVTVAEADIDCQGEGLLDRKAHRIVQGLHQLVVLGKSPGFGVPSLTASRLASGAAPFKTPPLAKPFPAATPRTAVPWPEASGWAPVPEELRKPGPR